MRRGIALLGLALLAACGGGEAADPTTTSTSTSTTTTEPTTTTSSATTATTAATPTTTYAQAPDPPALVLTGEDFTAIVDSMLAYSEWISVHPDPARVAEYAKQGSDAWQRTTQIMGGFRDQGLHTDGLAPAFTQDVHVLERVSDDLAVVYVAAVNPAYDVLRADGSVVDRIAGTPATGFAWHLERQSDGRWLLTQRDELGPL